MDHARWADKLLAQDGGLKCITLFWLPVGKLKTLPGNHEDGLVGLAERCRINRLATSLPGLACPRKGTPAAVKNGLGEIEDGKFGVAVEPTGIPPRVLSMFSPI
jgi:hypothetical protein